MNKNLLKDYKYNLSKLEEIQKEELLIKTHLIESVKNAVINTLNEFYPPISNEDEEIENISITPAGVWVILNRCDISLVFLNSLAEDLEIKPEYITIEANDDNVEILLQDKGGICVEY